MSDNTLRIVAIVKRQAGYNFLKKIAGKNKVHHRATGVETAFFDGGSISDLLALNNCDDIYGAVSFTKEEVAASLPHMDPNIERIALPVDNPDRPVAAQTGLTVISGAGWEDRALNFSVYEISPTYTRTIETDDNIWYIAEYGSACAGQSKAALKAIRVDR